MVGNPAQEESRLSVVRCPLSGVSGLSLGQGVSTEPDTARESESACHGRAAVNDGGAADVLADARARQGDHDRP